MSCQVRLVDVMCKQALKKLNSTISDSLGLQVEFEGNILIQIKAVLQCALKDTAKKALLQDLLHFCSSAEAAAAPRSTNSGTIGRNFILSAPRKLPPFCIDALSKKN